MGWIKDQLHRDSRQSLQNGPQEQQFTDAARERWRKLSEELRSDVAEFNSYRSGAEFSQDDENTMRIRNGDSGLELTLTADFDNQNVRYNYAALNSRSAGAPEGGMLSMRQCRGGRVEFYSADERLTSEETRQVLLEPMLFPKQSAA